MTELGSHEDMDGNRVALAVGGGETGTSCGIFVLAGEVGAFSNTRGAFAPGEVPERGVFWTRSSSRPSSSRLIRFRFACFLDGPAPLQFWHVDEVETVASRSATRFSRSWRNETVLIRISCLNSFSFSFLPRPFGLGFVFFVLSVSSSSSSSSSGSADSAGSDFI